MLGSPLICLIPCCLPNPYPSDFIAWILPNLLVDVLCSCLFEQVPPIATNPPAKGPNPVLFRPWTKPNFWPLFFWFTDGFLYQLNIGRLLESSVSDSFLSQSDSNGNFRNLPEYQCQMSFVLLSRPALPDACLICRNIFFWSVIYPVGAVWVGILCGRLSIALC